MQSTVSNPISLKYVVTSSHSHISFPGRFFPSAFLTLLLYPLYLPPPPFVSMPRPSHFPLSYNMNYIC